MGVLTQNGLDISVLVHVPANPRQLKTCPHTQPQEDFRRIGVFNMEYGNYIEKRRNYQACNKGGLVGSCTLNHYILMTFLNCQDNSLIVLGSTYILWFYDNIE